MECPHCKFIAETFKQDEFSNEKEYQIMTEVFVYLHDRKDYCDFNLKGEK